MKYLFIDNFRGFSNAAIPIRDVNFLVGENSTGKTSLLGILRLISTPRFLLDQGFSDEHVSLGNFSDMVSIHASDRTYFHIGLAWEESGNKSNGNGAVGWLLTYIDDSGIPRLDRYTVCRNGRTLHLRFGPQSTKFKWIDHAVAPSLQDVVTALPQWALVHRSSEDKGYENLSTPKAWGRVPLLIALSMCSQGAKATGKGEVKVKVKRSTNVDINSPEGLTFAPDLTWIAPIRTKPRPTYGESPKDFDPEGEHTPYLIRRILRSKTQASEFHAFMKKVGEASGLFQDVIIKKFGREKGGPFEVDIIIDEKALKLTTVGYGVSQSLPVLVEILARHHGSWFAIQQPEVHLHPRAQAALGDVVFEMAKTEHKGFLIETHSDFMIDRFRMNYRNGKSSPDSQIIFFERQEKHNAVTVLPISKEGNLPSDQPKSYREFFIKEQMDLLGM